MLKKERKKRERKRERKRDLSDMKPPALFIFSTHSCRQSKKASKNTQTHNHTHPNT
jgi:hypothetical protein